MKYKLFIFDFDGTLVDTVKDVAICFNEALKFWGYSTKTVQEICSLVGGDLETIVSKLLPEDELNQDNIDKVKQKYRELYLASSKESSVPYNGICNLLDFIKQQGGMIAINSNKGQMLLDDMVKKIFPNYSFESIVGYTEGVPSKPNPYGVEKILHQTGVEKSDAVYIGDGKSDMLTAYNAGLSFIYVSWGQGDLSSYNCFTAHNSNELKNLLI